MSYRAPAPFIKWAGGKRWLAELVAAMVTNDLRVYREPFLGSGAVYMRLLPDRAVLSDSNEELINAYTVVKQSVDALIRKLKTFSSDEKAYYRIRASSPRTVVSKAARFIYLNKTCWNGLYRVNRAGWFNVPYGHYFGRTIFSPANLRAVSAALRRAKLVQADFQGALEEADAGDLLFLDPPYRTVQGGDVFNRYTPVFFTEGDLKRLAEVCRRLDRRGCRIIMTHLVTEEIQEMFPYLAVTKLKNKWNISRDGSFRKVVEEGIYSNVPMVSGQRLQGWR